MPAAFPGDEGGIAETGSAGRELSQQELRRLIELEYKEARAREGRGGSLLLWEDTMSQEQKDLLAREYERAVSEERALVDESEPDSDAQLGVALPALADVVTHSNVRLSFEDGEPSYQAPDAILDLPGLRGAGGSNRLGNADGGAPAALATPFQGTESFTPMLGARLGFTPEVSKLTSAATVASAIVDDLENSVGVSSGDHDDVSRSVARERLGRLQSRLSPLVESLRALGAHQAHPGDGSNGSGSPVPTIQMPEDARSTVEALLAHTRVMYATIALRHRRLDAGGATHLSAVEAERRSIRLELVERELQLADHIGLKLEAALEAVGVAEGMTRTRLKPTSTSSWRAQRGTDHSPVDTSDGRCGGVNGCGSVHLLGAVTECGSARASLRASAKSAPATPAASRRPVPVPGLSAAEKALVEVRRRRGLELYQAVRGRDGSAVHALMLEPDLVNVNVCDEQHNTPLHLAVALGDVASARAILDHPEVDANRRTRRREWTPLHVLAARRVPKGESTARQHQLAVVLLQSRKTDANAKTLAGDTPVELAALKGNSEMVRILEGALRRRETGSVSGGSSAREEESGSPPPPHMQDWLRREEVLFQEQWVSQNSVCQTPEGGAPDSLLSI